MPTQTTEQLVEYYAGLLIFQYVSLPKAYATMYADALPVLMPQGYSTVQLTDINNVLLTDAEGNILCSLLQGEILPLALQDCFTLGTAVGVQLDTIAKYIGGLRTNLQLNGTYLTFNDTQFAAYLLIIAARNGIGSSMEDIESFFNQYFPGDFSVYDYENMRMGFTYYQASGANPVAESFLMAGYLPVPDAVGASLVFNPNNYSFFGFRTYNDVSQPHISGYNFYSDAQTGKFLSYANVIDVPII